MDMKKKLENAYNPDKQGQKEKIVIGLSGGIDSYVTAYLLKIQKYELIGVTVANSWDDFTGDGSKIFSCHTDQQKIEEMKEFCHKIGIPLHIVKASNEFKESVIEPWLADKALGKFPKPCWNCHDLRMKLLYEKMVEVGARRMATGHFAKLFHHESHGTVFVHTSNDDQHDQSALLSRVPHDVLNSIILPLSDLSKKEVLKLAENFGLIEDNKKIPIHHCLEWNEELAALVTKKMPKKFIKEGDITTADGTQSFGQHEGIQSHTLGEEYEYRDGGKPVKGIFGDYSYPEKRMMIFDPSFFMRDKFLLTNCHISEEVSWIEPVKGYVMFSQDEMVECWIHPKPLNCVYIEMSESHKLMNGQMLGLVKKKGKNSKLFLTGEVLMLEPEEETPEGEQSVPKVNYSLDF
jgi:tRNA U34 2-thiouridine synthase MnmA/TrmU